METVWNIFTNKLVYERECFWSFWLRREVWYSLFLALLLLWCFLWGCTICFYSYVLFMFFTFVYTQLLTIRRKLVCSEDSFLFVQRSRYQDRAVSRRGKFLCISAFSIDSGDMRTAVHRDRFLRVFLFDQRSKSGDRSGREVRTGILHVFNFFKKLSFI